MHTWIENHWQVINSHIPNYLLRFFKYRSLIKSPELLIQNAIRKLHNNLLNPKEEGFDSQYFKNVSVIISDTTYIKLLPDNLSNTRNRYKVMCGYEIRISISMIQSGLNT